MSDVSVVIGRSDEGKYTIRVSVYSTKVIRNGARLKASTDVEPGKASGKDELTKLIFVAGAACAEQLCEKHKEHHDPSLCGHAAVKDFVRECALMDELRQGFMPKLTSLLGKPLQPRERQRVDKLRFSVGRGASPTQEDAIWVDGLLARFSRKRR